MHEALVGKPTVGPGDVLVKVHGASVGGGEAMIRAGKIAIVTGRKFPKESGVDFAGEVVSVGSGVSGIVPHDRVWGLLPHMQFGAIAGFVAVTAARLAPAPRQVGLVEAAALPAVGTTVNRPGA